MSKSYQNAIFLTEPEEALQKKVSNCITDPNRVKRSDPGNPDICTIYAYHKLFTAPEKVSEINMQCRSAQIGCVEDKKVALESIQSFLKPIAEKRKALQGEGALVEKILKEGAVRARKVAQANLSRIYQVMGL
jgi:tryptophanyl-tRNA synthetase